MFERQIIYCRSVHFPIFLSFEKHNKMGPFLGELPGKKVDNIRQKGPKDHGAIYVFAEIGKELCTMSFYRREKQLIRTSTISK